MHDVLRQRLLRKIESLPEEQVYQVLDYIEFLESKYARHLPQEATGLQKFAEGLEDRLRRKAVSPATIREAFQLIAAADRVLSSVSTAGSRLLGELGTLGDGELAGPAEAGGERAGAVGRGEGSGRARAGVGRPAGGDREPPRDPRRSGSARPEREAPGAARPDASETPPHGDPLRSREDRERGGTEGSRQG